MAIPRAQELNQQITFQTKAGARKSVTKRAIAPVAYATVWAKIRELGGAVEETTMQSEAAMQQYEIWCRFNSGVTAFMQILWGTRTLQQTGPPQEIIDTNNRRWMLITAQETTEV